MQSVVATGARPVSGELLFPPPPWAPTRVAQVLADPNRAALPNWPGGGQLRERATGPTVQVLHNDIEVLAGCHFGKWGTELIAGLGGWYEPAKDVAFGALLDALGAGSSETAARTMLDLGSSWGYYGLWFAQRFPGAAITCVEPDPRYAEVGRANFELNRVPALHVAGAVAGGEGRWRAFRPGSDEQVAPGHELGVIEVRRYDLAALAESSGTARFNLLVADIRGDETEFLTQCLPQLRARMVDALLISTHHHSISGAPDTHQQVVALLQAAGADVLADLTVHESTTGDGIVAAAFGPTASAAKLQLRAARARDTRFGDPEPQYAAVVGEVATRSAELAHARSQVRELAALTVSLQAELDLVSTQLRHCRAHEDQAREAQESAQHDQAQAALDAVLSSRSWRITRPLRKIMGQGG